VFGGVEGMLSTSAVLPLVGGTGVIFAPEDFWRAQDQIGTVHMLEVNWFQLHALAIWVESGSLVGLRRLLKRIMGLIVPQGQLVEALELRLFMIFDL